MKRIAQYQMGELLGAGGQGRCYKAKDRKSGRSVAIKVIAWELHPGSAKQQSQRMKREIKYLKGKQLPGVAQLLGSGDLPPSRELPRGGGYLVYELIGDGSTLRDRLSRTSGPTVSDVTEACTTLGQTLANLASLGIFHRDIKPQNIAFRDHNSWEAVLIDFGVARSVDATTITSTGKMWGSPWYSPPEWRSVPPQDDSTSINANAWDSYSYARTAAVCLVVALGRSLEEAEWLSNRELIGILRRQLPRTAHDLKQGLHQNPTLRYDLEFMCTYIGDLDLDILVASDLTNRTMLKHLKTACSAIETKVGVPLRCEGEDDRCITCLYAEGVPNAPHLELGDVICCPVPCIWFKSGLLKGRSTRRRVLRSQFAEWARCYHGKFSALGIGHMIRDDVESVIERIFSRVQIPDADMAIHWPLYLVSQARAYEDLAEGDTRGFDPLLELWKLLIEAAAHDR